MEISISLTDHELNLIKEILEINDIITILKEGNFDEFESNDLEGCIAEALRDLRGKHQSLSHAIVSLFLEKNEKKGR